MRYMFGSLADENSGLRQIVVPAETNWTKYISEANADGRIIFTDNMFLGATKLVGNITDANHDHVTIYNSDIVDGFNSNYVEGAVGGYARLGYTDENGKWVHGYFTAEKTSSDTLEAFNNGQEISQPEATEGQDIDNPGSEEEVLPSGDEEAIEEIVEEVAEGESFFLSSILYLPTNFAIMTSMLSLFAWI